MDLRLTGFSLQSLIGTKRVSKRSFVMSDSLSQEHSQNQSAHQSQSDEWDIDNLPNRLTLFRIGLIPIIIVCLSINMWGLESSDKWPKILGWIAAWTFVVASVTDFLDGYIARKRQIITVFGSFLDPIADKFLVISSLILLLGLDRIPVLIVIILVLREMYITALRLMATERGLKIPVSSLGKWKTTFQMIGIPMLMAYDKPWDIPFPLMGTIFIYLASLFSLYSATEYSVNLVKKIKLLRSERKKAQS